MTLIAVCYECWQSCMKNASYRILSNITFVRVILMLVITKMAYYFQFNLSYYCGSLNIMKEFVSFLALTCFNFVKIVIVNCADWSYEGETGPENWCKVSSGCCGTSQSPVDLNIQNFQMSQPFNFIAYDIAPSRATMANNGHSVVVGFSGDIVPRMEGGGLNGTYFFHSFHMHWGSDDKKGSEHTFAGKAFPMEMHLVHYSSKFPGLGAALQSAQPDALAVLGIMFTVGLNDHPTLKLLTDKIDAVQYDGQSTSIDPFPLGSMLPSVKQVFYRYMGSLTTPTCDESVAWTVFLVRSQMSQNQMAAFRKLYFTAEGVNPPVPMVNNFRPVQPLNGRKPSKVFGK